MGIDTSMYQNIGRGVKSVTDYDNEYTQQRQNKLSEMMSGMKMDEYKRGVDGQNALRQAVSGFGKDQTENYNALLRTGQLDEAQKYQKSNVDMDESRGKVAKQNVDLIDAKLNQSRGFLETVTTPEQYIAWHEGNHKDPVLGPALAARGVTAETARASIMQALQTPGGLQELLKKSALGIEKFTELNKPTFQTRNTGGTTDTLQLPGLGGAPSVVNSIKNTQSPDSIASTATTRRGQDLKFQTDSGANLIAGQAIVSKKIQDVELKLQDDYRAESKGFSETSTAMKKVFGAIETADKNPGSALAAGTAFMKILDPNSVVRESELGMALNASGWFDRATNIANTLQNGRVMTGHQKVNLKAAAEDLFEEAKAAQREVDSAYKKRAKDYGASPERVIVDRGQNSVRAKKDAAPAKVTNDADYNSLPSGASFIGPDGKTRRKP